MPAPCRIIPRNVFDLATLTSTIAPYSTTPLVNLKNDRRGRIARWPAASGTQSIKGTWNGQGFLVGGVSLDRFNLEPAATVRFRGFQNADWTGTTLIDTTAVAPYNAAALGSFTWGSDPFGMSIYDGYLGYKYWTKFFAKQTIQSFQFDIVDTTNSNQVIDVSRAILGDYIETTYNADPGAAAHWRSRTEQDEMDGGSLFSDRRVPRRVLTGQFSFLTPAERQAIYDFTRFVDTGKAFLITFQAGEGASLERDFTIPLAKFTEVPKIAWNYSLQHGTQFSVVEA
jgi:hypothetical protein